MPPVPAQLVVEDVVVEVVRKPVRSWRLSVRPPHGTVRLTVPLGTREASWREAILDKLAWIRRHQATLRQRPVVPELRYEAGETHYYLGQALHLVVQEQAGRSQVRLVAEVGELHLRVPPGTTPTQRAQVVGRWRRQQLRRLVPGLLAQWEPVVGAQTAAWGLKAMKTRWGTCSIRARRIWLNVALSEWPLACLRYVLVHELTHLHERLHSPRFWQLLAQALPTWHVAHLALKKGHPGVPLPLAA
ncbi:M48 family metallopeptidase [Hymenobacter sp. RP-2-7]|uniref:M48 family metallopeptidase n=1 Tax=Hymenobacter polaris TaxID=2682546 RepID=A0A7Y0AID2_9BACT|nr:SprT family zinc-dependent metalloprotease [Hymenobacter polaris]NML67911.1 M48 family metallopeptidase [Hymenobacter polaris]